MFQEQDSVPKKLDPWITITPLGRAVQILKGRRWDPSIEEKRTLENIENDFHQNSNNGSAHQIIISWNGDNDSENPQNWPGRYKILVVFIISVYSFIVYCGSSIILPSYEGLMFSFGKSREVTSLVLCLYVLGYGVGPLLFSPLSEIASIGRNPPYIICFTIFTLLSSVLGALNTFPAVVIIRFLQGLFGSPCLATGGASITDVYSGNKVMYGYTVWVACIYAAPGLGPLFATRAVERFGWHWSLWQIAILAAPLLLLLVLFLPETSHDTILLRRARRLRQFTGHTNIVARSELHYSTIRDHLKNSLIRPAEIAVKDPAIGFVCVYCALIYAIYYSFFEVFPLVYPQQGIYEMSAISYSLVFLACVIGPLIAVVFYLLYVKYKAEPLRILILSNRHEDVLIPALPAVCFTPAGLFLFAWTARASISWAVPTAGIVLYGGSTFIIYQTMLIYIPQSYPQYVASLLAASDFTRSATAAILIIVSPYMYDNLGITKGVTIVGSLSVLGIIGMFILWRYGSQMRARSSFAVGL